MGSQQGQPNLLVDDSGDEDGRVPSRTASRASKSRSRSVSPPWDGLSPHSIPLLPMQEGSSGQGIAGRSLLSRTPSPYPRKSDDLDRLGNGGGSGAGELRIGMGSASPGGADTGLGSWRKNGKLGWWLWNTQRGWMIYIGFLVVFYSGASFGLSVVNNFMLLSEFPIESEYCSVVKWGRPLYEKLFELFLTLTA